MISFFNVRTFHKTHLVTEIRHAELGSMENSNIENFSSPIVAISINTLPHHIFLVGKISPSYQKIALSDLSGHAIALRVNYISDQGEVSLSHPTLPFFLSAIIPSGKEFYGRIEGNRQEVHGWETFHLTTLNQNEVTDRLLLIGKRLKKLFSQKINIRLIEDLINSNQLDGTPEVIDSIMPFLSTDLIENFSQKLFDDEQLSEKLARQLPNDPWATDGIAWLRQWVALHENSLSYNTNKKLPSWFNWVNSPQNAINLNITKFHYNCSDSLGILGKVGLSGDIGSFAHACVSALRRQIKPKRNTAILACVRNEGIYLLEWIAYHRSIGIEWFFLYSNDNDDQSDKILKVLSDNGIITWIENPVQHGQAAQHKAYGHALSIMPDILDFKWVQILDADEFIALNPHYYKNINEYLKWTDMKAVDSISLNWIFIASEILKTDKDLYEKPLIERCRQFVRHDVIGDAGSRLVKSLFRPAKVFQSHAHYPLTSLRYDITMRLANGSRHEWRHPPGGEPSSPGFADQLHNDRICIYHYFYKSAEEWMWKSARNRGDNPYSSGVDLNNFVDGWIGNFMSQVHSTMRHGEETWITEKLPAMHSEISSLKKIPGMKIILDELYMSHRQKSNIIRKILVDNNISENLSASNKKFFDLLGLK